MFYWKGWTNCVYRIDEVSDDFFKYTAKDFQAYRRGMWQNYQIRRGTSSMAKNANATSPRREEEGEEIAAIPEPPKELTRVKSGEGMTLGSKHLSDYNFTIIRFRLPLKGDGGLTSVFLQAKFRPNQTIDGLFQFLEKCVVAKLPEIQLIIGPPV